MAELASQWILDGTADAVLRAKREEAAVRNAIVRNIFDGWPLASRNSGFFCWLPLPEGWTGIRFADAAREAGVLVAEGEHFLIGHDAPEHGVRLALGGIQDREGLREALKRIAYLLESRP
jgi:DNA-binding transcriptional MocR family regulator